MENYNVKFKILDSVIIILIFDILFLNYKRYPLYKIMDYKLLCII